VSAANPIASAHSKKISVISEYDAAQPYRWCKNEMELLYLHLHTLLIIAVPGV
jgi:hypothetical protein